jgi:Zn finger protein HypA/HybF involved in hydrogenase expression
MNRSQTNQQLNHQPTRKLLKAGCAPQLLTTRVIPVSAVISSETATTADSTVGNMSSSSAVASPVNSKAVLPTVKLLGKLRGGMPGEQYAVPGECPKCRTLNSLRRGETVCPRCRVIVHFDWLIKERKLSPAAWERIRCALCLPTEIKNLSPEQARAVCQLLDLWVERFSFDEQKAMTGEAVRTALAQSPGLPRLFGKSLKGTRRGGNGNAKRQPIPSAKFREVAARQGSFCFWCGIKVIRESEIPQGNRIVKNHSTVVYLSADGNLREEAFGTIDHLIRVTDGGNNRTENLVISCYSCNHEREIKTLRYNRPFARRRVPCENCGGRFFHPDWGCCSICGAAPPLKESSMRTTRLGKFWQLIKRTLLELFN